MWLVQKGYGKMLIKEIKPFYNTCSCYDWYLCQFGFNELGCWWYSYGKMDLQGGKLVQWCGGPIKVIHSGKWKALSWYSCVLRQLRWYVLENERCRTQHLFPEGCGRWWNEMQTRQSNDNRFGHKMIKVSGTIYHFMFWMLLSDKSLMLNETSKLLFGWLILFKWLRSKIVFRTHANDCNKSKVNWGICWWVW